MRRRPARQIKLGNVKIGANAPVSIQSMTNTDTKDIVSTVRQIKRLEKAGCEIIRVAVRDDASASAVRKIRPAISIPLEADIHFDHRLALKSVESGADGIRLNPGNIRVPRHIRLVMDACKERNIPIRIGANSGSVAGRYRALGEKAHAAGMVKSVMDYIKIFEKNKFFDIMISLKSSSVISTIYAYRQIASLCNYPLHIGVTATGCGEEAIIKSAIGIGSLLSEGIGDTIRVSLTGRPEDEVIAARHILQALKLRSFYHELISCPTCGRCQVDLEGIVKRVKRKLYAMPASARGNRFLTAAVMGCEVNGPGEAKTADVGIAFGRDSGILFRKSKIIKKISAKNAVKELIDALF
ncbi:MAG: flavodoxin-dependent (E)-4-hydroxy-3-methylbut-2-enyl-diphosphate synthase [Candidatus Omnitrophica bacterium]|nr:flavodoxin-dependent (E)-4-hydroxy-3-methylbut-2-enyl-diphosphate synthase [Candidatus Omnitrophota bacterium]